MDHDYLKYRPLKDDDKILVLGACTGEFVKEYKDDILEKGIFVVNVEPNPVICADLMKWIYENMPMNAVALNMAVYNKNGVMCFENKDNYLISNLSKVESQFPNEKVTECMVMCVTLDSLFQIYGFDCIFCDIEGAELEVFNSFYFCNIYYAIAAYHIRNGEPTYKTLMNRFNNCQIDYPDEWSKTVLYAGIK